MSNKLTKQGIRDLNSSKKPKKNDYLKLLCEHDYEPWVDFAAAKIGSKCKLCGDLVTK